MDDVSSRYRSRFLGIAAVLLVLNLAAAAWVAQRRSFMEPEARIYWGWMKGRPIYYGKLDGSRLMVVQDPLTGEYSDPVVVSPATPIGLLRLWWPIGASAAISLAVVAIVRNRRVRRALEAWRLPRLTMQRGMVAIGSIAAELWLSRIDARLATLGGFVLVLLLASAYRRGYLTTTDGPAGPGRDPILGRWIVAGYAVAAGLALAWFVAILVWEGFQPRPR